jgi:HAD superfamily hydrolase (TIGR01509 family)
MASALEGDGTENAECLTVNMQVRNAKVVILDIDGTLLLSNDAHANAFAEAARRLGINVHFDRIRLLIGKGSDKLIPEAFGFESDSDLGKKLQQLKGEIFKTSYLPSVEPTPGARALLVRFLRDRKRLAVATSAGKEDVTALLRRAGVGDLIETSASADEAESSKPDPDILEAALQKTGETHDAAVMIGDTPYDVEAANRAGIPIIAVRCGGWTDNELAGALGVFSDPADILVHYDQIFG